ncbi:hypothetical protein [Aphanothece hegewaldii]|nr:hypothetical protein [Aphanothece hegewaldii]
MSYAIIRIQAIQKELELLQKNLADELQGTQKPTQLQGLWKDIDISDDDIEEAQQAVFRTAYEKEDVIES